MQAHYSMKPWMICGLGNSNPYYYCLTWVDNDLSFLVLAVSFGLVVYIKDSMGHLPCGFVQRHGSPLLLIALDQFYQAIWYQRDTDALPRRPVGKPLDPKKAIPAWRFTNVAIFLLKAGANPNERPLAWN